jgi:hypothetical protein
MVCDVAAVLFSAPWFHTVLRSADARNGGELTTANVVPFVQYIEVQAKALIELADEVLIWFPVSSQARPLAEACSLRFRNAGILLYRLSTTLTLWATARKVTESVNAAANTHVANFLATSLSKLSLKATEDEAVHLRELVIRYPYLVKFLFPDAFALEGGGAPECDECSGIGWFWSGDTATVCETCLEREERASFHDSAPYTPPKPVDLSYESCELCVPKLEL